MVVTLAMLEMDGSSTQLECSRRNCERNVRCHCKYLRNALHFIIDNFVTVYKIVYSLLIDRLLEVLMNQSCKDQPCKEHLPVLQDQLRHHPTQ